MLVAYTWTSLVAHILYAVNSGINVFVYVMTDSKFRGDLAKVLKPGGIWSMGRRIRNTQQVILNI